MGADNANLRLQEAVAVLDATYHIAPKKGQEKAHWSNGAARLDAIAGDLPPAQQAPVRYHQSRMLALAGDKPAAVQLLEASVKSAPVLPESILLLSQLTYEEGNEASNRRRWQLEGILGTALPLSVWGRLHDGRLEEETAQQLGVAMKDNPDWPILPKIERGALLEIARLFAEMRIPEDAANAYREALYCGFTLPEFPRPGDDSWMSVAAAEHWMTVVRLELSVRKTNWAVQAVLMAAASAPRQTGAAREILQQMALGKMQVELPQPDEAKYRRIADLYANCLVHPRGGAALNQAAALLPKADLAARKQELAAEWKHMMDEYISGRKATAVLFGQFVGKAKDPMTVVPSRFPYESK